MSNVDWVMNQAEFKENIDKISSTMANIFLVLLVVVLVISFFSLITTTYVNVINQTNEIAILMVLGL
jgi:ABC-type antimicrobial peptide transport system permease subunit